ncbi:MAG: hypothetical protein WC735_01135 [Candidatus Paceibacterota bacterium]
MKYTNLAIFVVFFGTALFNSFQDRNWVEVVLFFVLGVMFLWSDTKKK